MIKAEIAWLARHALSRMDDLLFPPEIACLCCGDALGGEERSVCPACLRALEALSRRQEAWEAEGVSFPPFAYVHAAYPYEGAARELILRLKFQSIRAAAAPLAEAMALLPTGEEELIVPAPTTRRRLRQRGFNQAVLLADRLSHIWGMPMADALIRQDDRPAQSGLNEAQRMQNLTDCMRALPAVYGKRILLVDDVFTTGATAREAARALLTAGAVSVGVLTAAMAPQRSDPEQTKAEGLQNSPERTIL